MQILEILKMIEDETCIEINALFHQLLMLFQQFCFCVVGEYEQVQAHLGIRATTYALLVPLPRQVENILKTTNMDLNF